MGLSGRKKKILCVVCLNKVWLYVSLSLCLFHAVTTRMAVLVGEGSRWAPVISQSVKQRALESDMQGWKSQLLTDSWSPAT